MEFPPIFREFSDGTNPSLLAQIRIQLPETAIQNMSLSFQFELWKPTVSILYIPPSFVLRLQICCHIAPFEFLALVVDY